MQGLEDFIPLPAWRKNGVTTPLGLAIQVSQEAAADTEPLYTESNPNSLFFCFALFSNLNVTSQPMLLEAEINSSWDSCFP